MRIEFFHDVICSFCFPMSAVMRKLSAQREDIEIVHRSFALGWVESDFTRMFGTRQAVKGQVMHHWLRANEIDEEHRFNIEGMKQTDFLFPLSKKPLIAAKAAGLVAGEDGYWAAFDALQHKFFVEAKNIEEEAVIEEAIAETGVDMELWRRRYRAKDTEFAVLEDIDLAHSYNLPSVPCLIIDGEHMIYGFKSLASLNETLDELKSHKGFRLPLKKRLQKNG